MDIRGNKGLFHLQKGTFAKWFLEKEKHYNDTYRTITRILQNRKKLTDEMNLRFRTRGNKGLFAYFRKFKSIIIDEKTAIIKIIINIHKKSIIRICSPLTLLLSAFYENHCIDLVGHTGLEKTKRNIMEKYYFPNINTWIKKLIADCIQCQTNKVFAKTKSKQ